MLQLPPGDDRVRGEPGSYGSTGFSGVPASSRSTESAGKMVSPIRTYSAGKLVSPRETESAGKAISSGKSVALRVGSNSPGLLGSSFPSAGSSGLRQLFRPVTNSREITSQDKNAVDSCLSFFMVQM